MITMGVLAYGLNYRTASIELRERIAFPEDSIREALEQVVAEVSGVAEAAIISTCNRTELYCATPDNVDNVEPALAQWLADKREVTVAELSNTTYAHWDQDAARHLMRVACGLDSQVLGEPQILGQVKSAYEMARSLGTSGPQLNLLSQITLRTAKEVRTHTDIGRNPISVAYAAVSLAQQIFSDIRTKSALLIGAGETISLVAEHLATSGIQKMAIANRTLSNAQDLAASHNAQALQLTDIAQALPDYDIVIASTGSSLPVIGKGAVEAAIKQRRRRPIFMVDIAVPRDIEVEVGDLPDVYLYSFDDLTQIIESNIAQRRQAADQAEDFVTQGSQRYLEESRVKQDQALLRQFRSNADVLRQGELERALKDIENGVPANEALTKLANNLTNKLIHAPTVSIRQASAEGRADKLHLLREVFQLTADSDNIRHLVNAQPSVADKNKKD